MNLNELTKRAPAVKAKYPVGTRILLLSMEDPYSPVLSGTKGTVKFVDDLGTIHMEWDNGRTLGICPFEDDFRKLTDEELAAEKAER